MKRWLILCIAFLQLSATTQFSQLYKLPIFVSHYLEHTNNTFSFSTLKTFIVHHYGGHERDADWETDQKLPFMNADRVHIDPCYVSHFQLNLIPLTTEKTVHLVSVWSNQIHSFSYLDTIWEPPKNA